MSLHNDHIFWKIDKFQILAPIFNIFSLTRSEKASPFLCTLSQISETCNNLISLLSNVVRTVLIINLIIYSFFFISNEYFNGRPFRGFCSSNLSCRNVHGSSANPVFVYFQWRDDPWPDDTLQPPTLWLHWLSRLSRISHFILWNVIGLFFWPIFTFARRLNYSLR